MIAINSFKVFMTIVCLFDIIAGEDVKEDVFFREAPNAAARNVEYVPIEGEEHLYAAEERAVDARWYEIRHERAEGQQ